MFLKLKAIVYPFSLASLYLANKFSRVRISVRFLNSCMVYFFQNIKSETEMNARNRRHAHGRLSAAAVDGEDVQPVLLDF